jgi:hypothetical protein
MILIYRKYFMKESRFNKPGLFILVNILCYCFKTLEQYIPSLFVTNTEFNL